jgi:hypothetical protein
VVGANTAGFGLRNPFRRKPFFLETAIPAEVFTGGTATTPLVVVQTGVLDTARESATGIEW